MILPPEIWRMIFAFDPSYHEKYNDCMDEFLTKRNHKLVVKQLKYIISQNNMYVHDDLFRNDIHYNVNVVKLDFIHYALRKALKM